MFYKWGKDLEKRLILWGLVIFICARLLVLFTSLDILSEYEELYRGALTHQMVRGVWLAPWEYLDHSAEYSPGGTLVVAILAVPFFALFGPTYFALKCVGLLFACGTFLLWGIFIRKFFGRKALLWYMVLAIFSVPLATFFSLKTWGSHQEANFFTAACILLFYLIFWEKKDKPSLFLSLGIICGFALWFVLTFLITIAFIIMGWFVFDKRFYLRKKFYIFLSGFLIGYLPALYFGMRYGQNPLNINGSNLFFDLLFFNLKHAAYKFIFLFIEDLPRSFFFKDIWLSWAYYILFAAVFFLLLWINRVFIRRIIKSAAYPLRLIDYKVSPAELSKESLLFFYPALFFIGYFLSGTRRPPICCKDDYISYRYMIPLLPFIPVMLAVFFTQVRKHKLCIWILGAVLAVMGFLGNAGLVNMRNFAKYFSDKGYSYAALGDKIGLRLSTGLKKHFKKYSSLRKDEQEQLYEGLGAGIPWRMKKAKVNEIINFFAEEAEPAFWPALYRGWGSLSMVTSEGEFKKVLEVAHAVPQEFRLYFYEGAGREADFGGFDNFLLKARDVPQEYRNYFYRGVGYAIGSLFFHEPDKIHDSVSRIDKDYLGSAYGGLNLGMHER